MIKVFKQFLCLLIIFATTADASAVRTNAHHQSYLDKLHQEYQYTKQRDHALKNLITQYEHKLKAAKLANHSRISFYQQKLAHAKHMHHKLLEHEKAVAEAEREAAEEEYDLEEEEDSLDPLPDGLNSVDEEEALLDADGL